MKPEPMKEPRVRDAKAEEQAGLMLLLGVLLVCMAIAIAFGLVAGMLLLGVFFILVALVKAV